MRDHICLARSQFTRPAAGKFEALGVAPMAPASVAADNDNSDGDGSDEPSTMFEPTMFEPSTMFEPASVPMPVQEPEPIAAGKIEVTREHHRPAAEYAEDIMGAHLEGQALIDHHHEMERRKILATIKKRVSSARGTAADAITKRESRHSDDASDTAAAAVDSPPRSPRPTRPGGQGSPAAPAAAEELAFSADAVNASAAELDAELVDLLNETAVSSGFSALLTNEGKSLTGLPSRTRAGPTANLFFLPHDFAGQLAEVTAAFPPGFHPHRPKELRRESIQLLETLGTGQFGEVRSGLFQHEDTSIPEFPVAAKTLRVTSSNATQRDTLFKEACITAQFRHPHIVGLVGVVTVGEPLIMVVQLCQKGALSTILKHEMVPIPLIRKYCLGVARGMAHLARMRFIHRDLASRNVLIDNADCAKIAE